MKRRSIALLVLFAAFIVLFAARFAYELSRAERVQGQYQQMENFPQEQSFQPEGPSSYRKNYASAKIVVAEKAAATQVVDQKYERVADLSATTKAFDEDSRRIAAVAAETKALVSREDAYGLPGHRRLSLSLGVVPEAFDKAVDRLKGIGKLQSVTVTKKDRTADFRALEAKRLSLEKTRDGLRALKAPGAELADLIALETKILEIEGQIQELGVSLGDYSEANSFCTVNVTISEAAAGPTGARILEAALDSLSWALLVCLGAAAAALATAGAAALGAVAVARIRTLSEKKGGN